MGFLKLAEIISERRKRSVFQLARSSQRFSGMPSIRVMSDQRSVDEVMNLEIIVVILGKGN